MAESGVIADYLEALRGKLPAAYVEELADGLDEEYQHQRERGQGPDAAAAAAIAEFGDADRILAAFTEAAPARRTVRTLLATGPLVGGCWAVVLIAGHAWTWPVPHIVRIVFGVVLLSVIAVLLGAVRAGQYCRALNAATVGCVGLLVLDTTMLAALLRLMPGPCWVLLLALPAGMTRIAYTLEALHTMQIRPRTG